MKQLEFTGKTTEEALAKAQEHFGLPLDRLEVEVVDAGSGGLFGILGSKKARLLARPVGATAEQDLAEVMSVVGEQKQPTPRPQPDQPQPGPAAGPSIEPEPEPEPEAASEDEAGAEPGHEPDDQARPALAGASGPPQEIVESAVRVLSRLVAAMDDQARVQARRVDGGIELEVVGGEAGMLIGRRGQTLEALQYLTTRIVSHEAGRAVRLVVDAGGYRRRRQDSLVDLAQRMGAKARQSGRPVAVGPLNAQERRVVHMALRGVGGLSTASRGRGDLKKVIITPN